MILHSAETADRHLKEDLNSSVDFLGAKLVANVHVDGEKDQYLIITATANYIGGPLSELTLKKIEKLAGREAPWHRRECARDWLLD
ncbi:MAG: hypothetical protein ACLS3Z_07325 [Faecalibacterium sp.]